MNNISGVPWQPCDLMNRQVVSEYPRPRGYIALLNKTLRMSRFLIIKLVNNFNGLAKAARVLIGDILTTIFFTFLNISYKLKTS